MRPARVGPWLSLALVLILAVNGSPAWAAAGDLDPSFDGDGVVTTDFTDLDRWNAVAVQGDGKIIAAGDAYPLGGVDPSRDFAVARYTTSGALDPTFSGDGVLRTDFFFQDEAAYDLAIGSDGKIVVLGWTRNSSTAENFAVARYLPNGSLDSTFSTDGKNTVNFLGYEDQIGGVAIQPDGKVVIAGCTVPWGAEDTKFAVARFNVNGTLDTTFSGDGKNTFDFGNMDCAKDLFIAPGGKILVAGTRADTIYGIGDFALLRLNASGTLDTTFSGDGRLTTSFGGAEGVCFVQVLSSGKILVVGGKSTGAVVMARYNPGGKLDTTFDGDGKVTAPMDRAQINGAALLADGRIVVTGAVFDPDDGFEVDVLTRRFSRLGVPDATFGNAGTVVTDIGSGDLGWDVATQSDGRIVVVGEANLGGPGTGFTEMLVLRYLGS